MKQARLTDDAWNETVPDWQSAPAQSNEADRSGEDHPQTKQALWERAAAHAADVATEHFPEAPITAITWEISTRMQRSAGKAIYNGETEKITLRAPVVTADSDLTHPTMTDVIAVEEY